MTAPKVNWSERDQKYWVSTSEGTLMFESVLDAQSAARQAEIDNAVRERELLIAEWMRKSGMRQVAMFIEQGEHLK